MSDTVVEKKLDVIGTIKDGAALGMKNLVPILVNVLLWVLTVWIPYLNVGTTIALYVGIISKISKGETISMTEIFDAKYRKYMGEFFLTSGLMGMGIAAGMALFIIPGCVIALAWSLALLLTIDKGKNSTEALSLSNQCTYGNKLSMFGIYFLVSIAFGIVGGIIMGLVSLIGVFILTVLVSLAIMICTMTIVIGIEASIYKQLTENI